MMVGRCWSNPVLLQSLRRKTHSCAAEPSSYAYIVSLSPAHTHSHTHTHIHTHIHTHTHTHKHTQRHIYIQINHPHRRLPQRELVLMCLFETTIISPSYTSHHGRHHILTNTKAILLNIHSYIRYIASPGKDKYI